MTEEDIAAIVADQVAEAINQQRDALLMLAANLNGLAAMEVDVVADSFEGLARAVQAAVQLEIAHRASRELKMAVFDADGTYIGIHYTTARTAEVVMGDACYRLEWRPEWDDIPPTMDHPLSLPTVRLPNLYDIPGAAEEIAGQIFGAFASSAVLG